MVFVAKEPVQLQTGESLIEENVIIEKIVVDKDHAREIAQKIEELTK